MSIKVGLALSGGGGCGFAHVGVLQVLIEHGVKIDCIAGTSMGSIVGGFYASGLKMENIFDIIETFKKKYVLDFNVLTLIKNGLISGNKLEKYLQEQLPVNNIENFKIPFKAVAVDVKSGKQFIFDKGNAAFAMRASSAVPAVFTACSFETKTFEPPGKL